MNGFNLKPLTSTVIFSSFNTYIVYSADLIKLNSKKQFKRDPNRCLHRIHIHETKEESEFGHIEYSSDTYKYHLYVSKDNFTRLTTLAFMKRVPESILFFIDSRKSKWHIKHFYIFVEG